MKKTNPDNVWVLSKNKVLTNPNFEKQAKEHGIVCLKDGSCFIEPTYHKERIAFGIEVILSLALFAYYYKINKLQP